MIKEFKPGQEKSIQLLIKSVFDEFVGYVYSDEGNKVFNDFINSEQILSRHNKGNIILTYEENGEIVGIIEVRDNDHICLFFVNKKYHSRGIGKRLFHSVLEKIKNKTDFVEVNASPFSEKIYSKLGFKKISELIEKNGIEFIPMRMEL